MGQIFSCAGKFGRKTKCQAEKQEQPDLSSQAVQTQIEEPASAAIQPQREDQHEEQYQSTSKVMGLPLDVIVMIFGLLEIHDAVAFSLACKGLHHHLFGDARALLKDAGPWEMRNVQAMLEKDLPHDQIYCHFCRRFHSLDKDYRKANCAEKDNPHTTLFATPIPGRHTPTLTYLDARAILNAVEFKRPWAKTSLKTLERTIRVGPRDNQWCQVWEPKVLYGALCLRITTGHDRKNTIREKDEFVYSICKHVHIHAKFPHMWAHLFELRRIVLCNRDKAAGTCDTCHAEWGLEMTWIDGDEGSSSRAGWDIVIQSWHNFGLLRYPSERLWALSAGGDRSPKTKWIEGDSTYILDHDGWKGQFAECPFTPSHRGPSEWTWLAAEEHDVYPFYTD